MSLTQCQHEKQTGNPSIQLQRQAFHHYAVVEGLFHATHMGLLNIAFYWLYHSLQRQHGSSGRLRQCADLGPRLFR